MDGFRRKKYLYLVPALVVIVVAALILSSSRKKNVLLIVVDTLRADRLSCYGWEEQTSPNLEALAAEGVLAEEMTCQVPQTLPSFCTILTGTYPLTHGVRGNGRFLLSPRADTLAEAFTGAGYRTGAFLAGFPLDSCFGLDQGFETYDDTMRSKRPMKDLRQLKDGTFFWLGHMGDCFENTADVVTDEVFHWLDEDDDRPFFLMVHYFDPHHDYAPPERFLDRFRHPYCGEIAFVDEQIGRLLDKLEEMDLDDDTLVIVTADHGECLGEHGRIQHQEHLTQATLHVPFLLRFPGVLPEGQRVRGLCRSVDIMPTVLELAELPCPSAVEGESLVPALYTGETRNQPCYFETLYGKLEGNTGVSRQGLSTGRWKFIHSERDNPDVGGKDVMLELYDLDYDPDEMKNLASEHPDSFWETSTLFDAFLLKYPENWAQTLKPDQETVEKLKALGYF